MVTEALAAVGAARSIVIDEDNVVLAGNGVQAAALAAGLTKVRVVDVEGDTVVAVRRSGLTAAQKRQLALYDNRTAELAEWNLEQLAADLANGEDLSAFFLADELTALLGPGAAQPGLTDPDAVPEARPTDIRRGDLFGLGAHRLLCGDSTNAEDVALVLDGARPDATITDPPYAVNYGESHKSRGGDVAVHTPYSESVDAHDALGFLRHLPTDVLVMSFPVDRHFSALAAALAASRLEVRKELVWVKDVFSFWPGAQYQQRHEPILVIARQGQPVNSDVPANETTVMEYPRPRAHDLHPTAKPIDLWLKLVRYHTTTSAFDPFLGSGTTLIACQQLSRQCYALEIEPSYVQVAIDRWEAFTGQRARKLPA